MGGKWLEVKHRNSHEGLLAAGGVGAVRGAARMRLRVVRLQAQGKHTEMAR